MTTPSRDSSSHGGDTEQGSRPQGLVRYVKALGPGVVTGASDDDPSGIATYAQTGATYNTAALWTVPVTLPLMMAVQEVCDRTALATGETLGTLARKKFTRHTRIVIGVLLVALLVANVVNIGADTLAVGKGMEMLGAGPAFVWNLVVGAGLSFVLLKGSFEVIEKVFKWLCLALFAYVAVLFFTQVNWGMVLTGLLGFQVRWEFAYWSLVAAIFGTTISPYLFFWQSGHRVEELRDEDRDGDDAEGLRSRGRRAAVTKQNMARLDVFVGMAFSVLIMFAIVVATGATLGQDGKTVESASDAAQALEPVAGPLAKYLFALGFIGSGILAIPVLASSGSIGLAGLLRKPWGLEDEPHKAPAFYWLVIGGTLLGTALSLFFQNPIQLLVLSATINAVAAAPFLVVVMLISRDRRLMGRYTNGKLSTVLGWLTVTVMSVLGIVGLAGMATGT